jgi:nucleoside 2-deoxyribosyltransferase
MKAYISVSFNKKTKLKRELAVIRETLNSFKINSFVFVEEYNFTKDQEKEMMQTAMKTIDDCDLLIAEVSDKAVGIGVEAGYAKAKGKTMIYVRNSEAEHSTTISGISDFSILYNDVNDIRIKLSLILSEIITRK